MEGPSGGQKPLSNDMSNEFNSVTAVYVYYKHLTSVEQPRVICIDEGNGTKHWYAAGNAANNWSKVSATNAITTKNPASLNDTDLDGAGAREININPGTTYVIKLDKRPSGTTANIKYRTKDIITVTKVENDANKGVPDNYVRYKHERSDGGTFDLNSVKHNGIELNGITGTNVTAVYVYYRQSSEDPNHEFPLIVCVKKSSTTTYAYHKRGNTWSQEGALDTVDPDNHEPQNQVPNN